MQKIKIQGGKELTGVINIGGAKNAAVALLPAAILCDEETNILNVPDITDKLALIDIIKVLNGKVSEQRGLLTIDASKIISR